MDRGFRYSSRRKSPPSRRRSELQGSSRMGSNRSQQASKQDLNIDDFGDMGSDEDDLSTNFVPRKFPVHPQYNLVPHGFLRDDDELADEDYDGVPIDSATSSPKPESPVRHWRSSPRKEEMKGDPIAVLGLGNRPLKQEMKGNPITVLGSGKWAHDTKGLDGSSGIHHPQGTGRWDNKIGQSGAGEVGKKIPSLMEVDFTKGPAFVRARDDDNPFLSKPQPPENSRNFDGDKDERNDFLRTMGQTSSGPSKTYVPAHPIVFPAKNDGYPARSDKPSPLDNVPAWTGLSRERPGAKEEVLSAPSPVLPQIGALQAAALQQALAGITHLDPQAGLNLLMQASQNPTLAAALAGNISTAGMTGSMQPLGISTVGTVPKSAAPSVPVASTSVALPNLGVPPPGYTGSSRTVPSKLPDGSGGTRYPAPDLNALVFDPSTGYRYDSSTGLHYDANSGYFFNSKLKIFMRWDKFTQTYLRVENPPGIPRVNLSADPSLRVNLTADPPPYQKGSAQSGVYSPSDPFSNEITPSKRFPTSIEEVRTVKNVPKSLFSEPANPVQSTVPRNMYSGGSQSHDSRYQPDEPKPKLVTLPNLAETSLFNKLRKAKLAAQTKPDRRQWGEPDPLLEAVQKLETRSTKPQSDVLNLEEILQRSRQFMKGSGGEPVTTKDEGNKNRIRARKSPNQSGDGRRMRSRSQSPARFQSSQSSGNARVTSNVDSSALQRHSGGRSPTNRARHQSPSPQPRKPALAEASPPRSRGRRSVSPRVRKHRPTSRGRSPHNRAQRSRSPEFCKKKSSSGCRSLKRSKSPGIRRGKYSKSPETKYRRTSKGRSTDQKPPLRLSNSPDRRRRHSLSHDRTSRNRTPSPIVKVVLNQSPGGTKVRITDKKRAANLVSDDRRGVLRKSGTTNDGSERMPPHGQRGIKEDRVGTKPGERKLEKKDDRKPEGRKDDQEKQQPTVSKHNTGQGSLKKISTSNKNVDTTSYKSLANLRNQTRDESRAAQDKRDTIRRLLEGKTSEPQPSKAANNTEDEERRSRENHRLVNERTFSAGWKTRKPERSELSSSENAPIPPEISIKDTAKENDDNPGVSIELEESNDFDFLKDTLDDAGDDDRESTVIDEYEEILDYHDLDSNSESKVMQSTVQESPVKPTDLAAKELSKESTESLGMSIDLSDDLRIDAAGVQNPEDLKNKQVENEERSGHTQERENEPEVCETSEGRNSRGEEHVQGDSKSPAFEHASNNDNSLEAENVEVTKEEINQETAKEPSGELQDENSKNEVNSEEWNVLDSVDDNEEESSAGVSPKNNPSDVAESQNVKIQDVQAVVNVQEAEEPPLTPAHSDAVPPQTVDKGDEISTALSADDGKAQASDGKGLPASDCTKEIEDGDPPIGKEESQPLVRSVSDIEKFLLLSSQEVEAKREQGADSSTSKVDKKSGVFSRLGEKLSQEQEPTDPAQAPEVPAETQVSPQTPPPAEPTKSSPKKKPQTPVKKPLPEDPCKGLFSDEPTCVVLIGPMNFIEPLPNFQNFTQKYMHIALTEEKGVRFLKIYVHHEDTTGAPFHYILVTFPSPLAASNWVKKHKGVYKGDPKIFKKTTGHTKHKLVRDAVAFLHFTKPNWVCAVCKKNNFPPRSLCFGCFQHKDPDGFTPLVLLDRGGPGWKNSNWVGTPKLKFFATKEKVLESVPPLGGFDILRVEMIMDEEMGLPAGICVFELPDHIDAGKLKKYLNRRDVEAVSVEMHERFLERLSDPTVAKKTPLKAREGTDLPGSGSDSLRDLPEDSGGRGRRNDRDSRSRSPRFSSRDLKVRTSRERMSSSIHGSSPSRHSPRRVTGSQSPGQGSLRDEGRYRSPARSVRAVVARTVRATRVDVDPSYQSTESEYHSPYVSPSRYRSRSPVCDPVRRRSPMARSRSPIPRGRSPVRRIRSPVRRIRSPIPRSRSPVLRRHTPVSRHSSRHSSPRWRSPVRRSRSPIPRSRSPVLRRHTPLSRHSSRHSSPRWRSPVRRSRSPLRRSRSPIPRGRSPLPKRRSPATRRRSPSGPPRRRSPSPRRRSPFGVRPIKPDGRSNWSYPPPDPTNFKFEPRSGLDYDPVTTLYYEPKSCCFYNDDTNEWLEYEPTTGCYRIVQ